MDALFTATNATILDSNAAQRGRKQLSDGEIWERPGLRLAREHQKRSYGDVAEAVPCVSY